MQYDEKLHIPIHARAAGVAILDHQDRILLVREKMEGKAGLWHIPSGSVERGESLEMAAKREAREETGLEVSFVSYLNTYVGRFPDGAFVARHVWLAEADPDQPVAPQLADEIAACRRFSMEDFEALYQAGKVRMYHTKLIFEEARALKQVLADRARCR